MSSTRNSQNLLTNVFRPTYVYTDGSGFSAGVVATNLKSVDVPTVRANILDIGDAGSNVYLGTNAGVLYSTNPTNTNVSAFGVNAAAGISNVCNSVFIGTAAGLGLSNATDTTVIGANDAVIGTRNVVIGNRDFIFGSNNIVIGSDVSINESFKLNIANLIIGDIGTDVCGAALIFNSDVKINGTFTSTLFDASGISVNDLAVPGYIRNDPIFNIVMDISQGNFAFSGSGPSRVSGIVFSNYRIDASQGIHGAGYDLSSGLFLSGDVSLNGALRLLSTSSNQIGGVTLSNTNISNAGTTTSSNFVGTASASNTIGGVTLSNTNISNAGTTTSSNFVGTASASNTIGGVTLSNTNISNAGTTTSSNFVGTASASNTIGGVTLSNTNISNAGTTTSSNFVGTAAASNSIGGVTLSNTNITYAGAISNSVITTSNSIGGVTLSNSRIISPTGTISSPGVCVNDASTGFFKSFGVVLVANGVRSAEFTSCNIQFYNNGTYAGQLSNFQFQLANNVTSANPPYSFSNDPASGLFYNNAVGQIGLATGGIGRLFVSNSNVGIGTSAPTTALAVVGDISTSGFIRTGAGTVSAPSHSFNADVSMGMFQLGTNALGFVTQGVARMTICGDAVGIGTTSPARSLGYLLDICGGGIHTRVNNTPGFALLQTFANSGYAGTTDVSLRRFALALSNVESGTGTGSDLNLFTYSNNGNNGKSVLTVQRNGNVGIGTTTPTTALTVVGDISASGAIVFPQSAGKRVILFSNNAGGTLGLEVQASEFRQSADAAATAITWGYYTGATFTERMRLVNNSNGRLGIGTTTPAHTLDVSGTIRGSSNIIAVATASNWVNSLTSFTDTSLTIAYTPKQSGTVTLLVTANAELYVGAGSGNDDSAQLEIRNNGTVLTDFVLSFDANYPEGRNANNYSGGRMATVSVSGQSLINFRIFRGGDDTPTVRNGYLTIYELSTT